jgi:hypothetical protein
MENLPKLHTNAKLMVQSGRLWCNREIQEAEKHFVQDRGARTQHGANREDYREGGGEKDTFMDLLNFGGDVTKISSLKPKGMSCATVLGRM